VKTNNIQSYFSHIFQHISTITQDPPSSLPVFHGVARTLRPPRGRGSAGREGTRADFEGAHPRLGPGREKPEIRGGFFVDDISYGIYNHKLYKWIYNHKL